LSIDGVSEALPHCETVALSLVPTVSNTADIFWGPIAMRRLLKAKSK
jgi:hypothetical protein